MIFYDIVFVKPFWTYIYIYTYRCQGKMACNYMCSVYTLHSWPFAIFTPWIVSKTASRANGTGPTNSGEGDLTVQRIQIQRMCFPFDHDQPRAGSSSGNGPGRWRSGTEAWLKFRRGSIGRSCCWMDRGVIYLFFLMEIYTKKRMLSWVTLANDDQLTLLDWNALGWLQGPRSLDINILHQHCRAKYS